LNILRKIASSNNTDNLSSKFRRKRFKIFQTYIAKVKLTRPKILDVGGTEDYWNQINLIFGTNFQPIINNISKDELNQGNFNGIVDDGKCLSSIKDNSFDITYSNSVIEHLSTFEDQQKMTNNLQRVAQYYFVQTPAFIFPFEPHFLFPFFHWLPRMIRIWLVLHINLGWFKKCNTKMEAELSVDSIRILKKRELRILFKDATLIKENFLMMSKSYIITNMN
jgi:hypothetical protein